MSFKKKLAEALYKSSRNWTQEDCLEIVKADESVIPFIANHLIGCDNCPLNNVTCFEDDPSIICDNKINVVLWEDN